jgi:hypothetical protein
MAEYLGPSTTNEAEMIATTDGRIVPDRYATGHDNDDKLQSNHARRIHNDIYARYDNDHPEGFTRIEGVCP